MKMKRLFRVLPAMAMGFGLLLAWSGTASAVPLLQSNSSWKVTPTDPTGSDWYTNSGFDDSGWQNATELFDAGIVLSDPTYAGAKGIWSSGGLNSTTETQVWMRKTFDIAAPLSTASLRFDCDDDCMVWVNGTLIINDADTHATSNNVANMLPYLTVGSNLIAATVTDNYLTYGYQHAAWVHMEGEFSSVPEPSTLLLLGSGLAGMGIWRSRRRKES